MYLVHKLNNVRIALDNAFFKKRLMTKEYN